MESHGLPGRIQVTTETAERLGGAYAFERRGVIDVKGKGRLETWFLTERLPGALVVAADHREPAAGG
jgi:adenylate cyclase